MPRLTRGKFGWSEGSMVIIEVIYYERLIEFCGKVSLCHVLHKLSNELLKCALGLSDCRKEKEYQYWLCSQVCPPMLRLA